ncbi:radical SAM protein [candidate division WOR-3 bacterium]|uniref:Radical SAM protein n=1 Tax=candidate division WOR-3 bacterium TaxID=2052148 RepID=A0A937XHF2_UNCW3|nr:radical SAM protein [candidate division WOR-3 bacterium]
MTTDFLGRFDAQVARVFRYAARAAWKNPRQAVFFARIQAAQSRSARLRDQQRERGVQVPPLVIASITNRCNLHCRGCYARARHGTRRPELTDERWADLFGQAQELGVSVIMIAGGEPLMRPGILDVTRMFPGLIFPLFTNGLLLDDSVIARFRSQPQVIPVLSVEGWEPETDTRRGEGVFEAVAAAAEKLRRAGIFFGASLTVTRRNFEAVTAEGLVQALIGNGCSLFIFVEYTPAEPGTEDLTLLPAQRHKLVEFSEGLQKTARPVFIVFPGDEEQFGGCLAAGRGFVHVGPDGSLEPCPFAPYSDTSVAEKPFKEALASHLLKAIRDNHAQLKETRGGCALWRRREWVEGLAKKQER